MVRGQQLQNQEPEEEGTQEAAVGEIQEAAQGENQLETNTPATGAGQLTASYSVKRMIALVKKS